MLSQGYTDSMFSVYPEDLLNELIVFRIFSVSAGASIVFWGIIGLLCLDGPNIGPLEIPNLSKLLTFIMVIDWFIVSTKMLNPFGSDKGFDVDLNKELDINIWKSSVMIQQQDLTRLKREK